MEHVEQEPINLSTPLALLTPAQAYIYSSRQLVIAGSLSIFIWDILQTLALEYQLLMFFSKTDRATIAYFASRVFTLLALILNAVANMAGSNNCSQLNSATIGFTLLARAFTGLLFYIRTMALYTTSRLFRLFLTGAYLLSILGACGTLSTHSFQISIQPTPTNPYPKSLCEFKIKGFWMFASVPLSESLFNIVVCVAATYKIRQLRGDNDEFRSDTQNSKVSAKWKTWFFRRRGHFESRLADRYLRDSQIYFIITLATKVPCIIIIALMHTLPQAMTPLVPFVLYADIVICNIMATRVYRNMKLGRKGLNLFVVRTLEDPTFIDPNGFPSPSRLQFFRPTTAPSAC